MKKRILSVFLTVAMILTSVVFVIPTVSAEGDDTNEPPTPVAATGLWTESAATAFDGGIAYGTEGHGTEENPYKIATPEQLAYLAKLANEYTIDGRMGVGNSFEGEYFVLTQDIDLSGHYWMPIAATYTKAAGYQFEGLTSRIQLQLSFKGIFDGQNYSITGITFGDGMLDSDKVPAEIAAFGLFGTLCGTVKNLKVEGTAVFTALKSFNIAYYKDGGIAILAGAATEGALIENVEANVFVDVSASKAELLVGGMVAYTSDGATLKNCTLYGSVTSTSTGVALAGGVIACAVDGTDLYNCVNYATVKAVTTKASTIVIAGGLLGKSHANAYADDPDNNFRMGIGAKITGMANCSNYGSISAEGTECKARVGGCIGNAGRGGKGDYLLDSCVNYGEISANYYDKTAKQAGIAPIVGLQETVNAQMRKCLSTTYATCTDATTAADMSNGLLKIIASRKMNGTIIDTECFLSPKGNLFVATGTDLVTAIDGASLRLNPSKKELASLRFDAVLSAEAMIALADMPVKVGTILIPAAVFEAALADSANTAEAMKKLNIDQYRDVKANIAEDGSFSAIYANITEADFATDMIAIPYLSIVLDVKTGASYTLYDEYTVGDSARTVNVKGIAKVYYDTRCDDATDPYYFTGPQLELLEYYMSK